MAPRGRRTAFCDHDLLAQSRRLSVRDPCDGKYAVNSIRPANFAVHPRKRHGEASAGAGRHAGGGAAAFPAVRAANRACGQEENQMTNVWQRPMTASEVMTRNVLAVAPETPRRTVAKLLLDRGISAAPVVDADGHVIGMVSENDLLGREIERRVPRREWWLELLAEGEDLAPEFLEHVRAADRPVREVMVSPVVTVSESTSIEEIAEILQRNHIKRVPVLRDGRMVGIVSRADLIRALSQAAGPAR
jgi:CBS domain-containing protein